MLCSSMFIEEGGILGFHSTYQYPQTVKGTYYYQRYPLTLKGADAVLFTLFRTFGLTVHIKACEGYFYVSSEDTTTRCRGLISTQDDIGESKAKDVSASTILKTAQQISDFERSYYVGDEIFRNVTWFNGCAAKEGRKEYYKVPRPVSN